MKVPEKKYLGQEVRVQIDRPLGSRHPDFDMIYPLNYGYLPGTLAADGEPIDAYVLGPDKALKFFTGQVIALVIRHDDVENKLVVAAPGLDYTTEEIFSLIHFQEQYFQIEILTSPGL